MNCISKREQNKLVDCYSLIAESTTSLIKDDISSDEFAMIKKYEEVRVLNIYLETPTNPMSHLYRADIDSDIHVEDNRVRLSGYDEKEDVKVTVSITEQHGDERVAVSISRKNIPTIDGPWEDDNILFRNRDDPSELNILITKEV